jgi:type II secretory pathway pseudopilin PulG
MNRKAAFTLVEVITGIVILGVISTCSWLAVSTLFRGEQLSRNTTVATNLLQKSQEELRKSSLTFYDSLENCQFPGPAFLGTNIACGLQALGAQFNGYTRSVVITPENSSTELKKAVITVNWTDQGNNKKMLSAVLLARPPDPLPGNIIGTVRSSAVANNLIQDASITVTLVGGAASRTTTSKTNLGSKNENYDFFDSATGAFLLPVGTWKLTATQPNYYSYTHTADITVTSNAETRVEFLMDPKPQDGTINIRMIDGNTRNLLPNYNGGRVQILDSYQETGTYWPVDNATTWSKTIKFEDVNPRTFTVDTWWAYRSGYVGKTLKNGPPNCNYNYNSTGWSSAVMLDDTSTLFACDKPYHGSHATDRFTVNPGETITVDVPLYPLPLATITGTVVDARGNPLANSLIYAQWPIDGTWWSKNGSYQTATTDSQGKFSFVVPAAQEMFANNAGGAMTLRAEHNMPATGCCDSAQQILKYGYKAVTNLFEGSTVSSVEITIPDAGNTTCGNVKGVIKDGESNLTLNEVNVNVQGVGTSTAGFGDYIYQCPETGFRLPVGLSRFYASKGASYYGYDSNGNNWYAPAPSVNVKSNVMVDYDAKLWPIGVGTVVVNVKDAGTNNALSGAKVRLQTYNGGDVPLITGADGKVTFNNTLETWPPVGLPGDAYYNQTPHSHNLTVSHPSGFYSSHTQSIPVLEKNDTLTIEVRLTPSGGT